MSESELKELLIGDLEFADSIQGTSTLRKAYDYLFWAVNKACDGPYAITDSPPGFTTCPEDTAEVQK